MPGPRNRGREINVGVLMLLYQMSQFGFGKIPPVTLMYIAFMSMLFTGFIQVPWTKEDACVSSNKVLHDGDWKRLLISAFEHGDDMHLYYNMISFLVKGINLEPKLGSLYFGYLNLVFSVACSAIYVGLAQMMAKMFTPLYLDQCAIGFSAVIFALKVLVSAYSVSRLVHLAPGVVVPSNWAYWLELVLIQVMVPNASFIGHLAGILVGLLFVRGPLKFVMDLPFMVFTGRRTPDPRIEAHEEVEELDLLLPEEAKRRRAYRQELEKSIYPTERRSLMPNGSASILDPGSAFGLQLPSGGVRSDWFYRSRPSYSYGSGVSGRGRSRQPSMPPPFAIPGFSDTDISEALRRSRQEYEEDELLRKAREESQRTYDEEVRKRSRRLVSGPNAYEWR